MDLADCPPFCAAPAPAPNPAPDPGEHVVNTKTEKREKSQHLPGTRPDRRVTGGTAETKSPGAGPWRHSRVVGGGGIARRCGGNRLFSAASVEAPVLLTVPADHI